MIVGGGSGIGKAISLELAARYPAIVVADVVADRATDVAKTAQLKQNTEAIAVCVDVRHDAMSIALLSSPGSSVRSRFWSTLSALPLSDHQSTLRLMNGHD